MILHICCAPCGGGCVERLKEEELQKPLLFYSNSNIDTKEEFERRLESVRLLAESTASELVVDPYDHAAWLQAVKGLEREPEHGARCARCFAFSLGRCADFAAGRPFCTTLTVSPRKDSKVIFAAGRPFCTTLTVSPRKNSKVIFASGAAWANFVPMDFKKRDGYKRSCQIAREKGFYRQNYCGCEFSRIHGGNDENHISGQ